MEMMSHTLYNYKVAKHYLCEKCFFILWNSNKSFEYLFSGAFCDKWEFPIKMTLTHNCEHWLKIVQIFERIFFLNLVWKMGSFLIVLLGHSLLRMEVIW